MSSITLDQPLVALQRANEVRSAMSEVRLELAAGVSTLAAALDDERAASMQVFDLLRSVRRVGPSTARRVMFRAGVPELKRVRALTDRQRHALITELAEEVRDADLS